jgi:hypothetical protein
MGLESGSMNFVKMHSLLQPFSCGGLKMAIAWEWKVCLFVSALGRKREGAI